MITFFVVYFGLIRFRKRHRKEPPPPEEQPFQWKKILLGAVYILAIVALVMEATIMPEAIQITLSPTDRAA